MTNRKRPWWLLHWPSWLALVVFGGAFVVLHLLSRGHVVGTVPEYVAGWPFEACRVDADWAAPVPWLWDLEGWNKPFAPKPGDAIPRPEFNWNPGLLTLNVAIGSLLFFLATSTVERFCRRHLVGLTLRSLFCACAVIGSLVAMFRVDRVEGLRVTLNGMSLVVICFAIGLASLTVLDFIGWLFSRLSKREA